jgi:hypothetical protein
LELTDREEHTMNTITLTPGDVISLHGRTAIVTNIVDADGTDYAGYRYFVGYGKATERVSRQVHAIRATVHTDSVQVLGHRPDLIPAS